MTLLQELLEKHPRPWRVVDYPQTEEEHAKFTISGLDIFQTGYGRVSTVVIDDNNKRVIALDPSQGEYDSAFADDVAYLIVGLVNTLELKE